MRLTLAALLLALPLAAFAADEKEAMPETTTYYFAQGDPAVVS